MLVEDNMAICPVSTLCSYLKPQRSTATTTFELGEVSWCQSSNCEIISFQLDLVITVLITKHNCSFLWVSIDSIDHLCSVSELWHPC